MGGVKVKPVCKDFLRGQCSRGAMECRFAHHSSTDHHVTVCKDFLRGNCRRKACIYSHVSDFVTPQQLGTPVKLPIFESQTGNGTMAYSRETRVKRIRTADVPLAPVIRIAPSSPSSSCSRSPSASPGKSRSSSPSPSAQRRPKRHRSDDDDEYDDDISNNERRETRWTALSVDVCKNFMRNACKRSLIDCKFAHPHSSVQIFEDKVTACADSLKNQCYRGMTCRYFHPPPHIQESLLKATNTRGVKVEPVCKDFLRGRCSRGAKECRFAHHSSTDHHVIVCKDFSRGNCRRKACRYSHASDFVFSQLGTPVKLPISESQTGNDQDILPVCMDFLKNNCWRERCKYAHPEKGAKVTDNQVEVCRDFCGGVCRRTACRFYHPPSVTGVPRVLEHVHDIRPLLYTSNKIPVLHSAAAASRYYGT